MATSAILQRPTPTSKSAPSDSAITNERQTELNHPAAAMRKHLPEERSSVTHKFIVGGFKGYITVGLYANGDPGEIFITMAKEGSTLSGFISSFAKAVSIGLQYGVPLTLYCEKFARTRFEPAGWTGNPDIGYASSVMDYIFRWLERRFIGKSNQMHAEQPSPVVESATRIPDADRFDTTQLIRPTDTPPCKICGALMQRNGSCHICTNCGHTSGCS